jgi:hypothetical protein
MNEIGIYDSSLRLEETVVPSPNSVDLSRSIGNDYINRFSNATPNVAEIFHVNSKISRFNPLEVPEDRTVLYTARDWFYRTAYALTEDDFAQEFADRVRWGYDRLPAAVGKFLHKAVFDARFSGLMHGVDIFVVADRTVLRALPRRDFLWIERRLSDELLNQLDAAFYQTTERPNFRDDVGIFLVGSFWRYMKFFGPRGYRMVLMDCGELMHELERSLGAIRFESFFDCEVDDVLLLDGVEHSVLTALSIKNDSLGAAS